MEKRRETQWGDVPGPDLWGKRAYLARSVTGRLYRWAQQGSVLFCVIILLATVADEAFAFGVVSEAKASFIVGFRQPSIMQNGAQNEVIRAGFDACRDLGLLVGLKRDFARIDLIRGEQIADFIKVPFSQFDRININFRTGNVKPSFYAPNNPSSATDVLLFNFDKRRVAEYSLDSGISDERPWPFQVSERAFGNLGAPLCCTQQAYGGDNEKGGQNVQSERIVGKPIIGRTLLAYLIGGLGGALFLIIEWWMTR